MSNQQTPIIILMGRSGCGKGTQAKFIQKEFGFDYLSSGDLLRARIKKDDFSGKKLNKVISKGDLAPTFFISHLWSEKMREKKDKLNLSGLIIDGSPRSLLEAELMNDIFKWYEWTNIKVILLDISNKEAFGRLTKRRICKECGQQIPWIGQSKKLKKCPQCDGELITRFDDKPEAIKARLDFYKKDVQPAVDYYKKQGKLIRVSGEQSIEDVRQEVRRALEGLTS